MESSMKGKGIIVLVALLILGVTNVSAQETLSKDQKSINKCWKVFETKGQLKGIEKLEKYMSKQAWPTVLAYESLVSMEYDYYTSKRTGLLEFNNEDGTVNDSLTDLFSKLLSEAYRTRFVNVCRRSTNESTSPSADTYLRRMFVDNDPDTLISEKGISYFDEAEEFFQKSDFELAELNYRKAIIENPTYYKANLYLGDSFWAREQYDSAMVYYTIAKELQPNLLEARIYIIDALANQGLYYRAKKECVDAMTVYPGYNLKYKLQRILTIENKLLDEHRVLLSFYANEMGNDDQITMSHSPLWLDYRKAKEDVSKYCNEDGIIEDNGEIKDRYLEVYSYRTMLEKHPNDLPDFLHFADEMREKGLLEPYVFTSLFHIDIYPQFKDYMSKEENRKKTREFIEAYLIVVDK